MQKTVQNCDIPNTIRATALKVQTQMTCVCAFVGSMSPRTSLLRVSWDNSSGELETEPAGIRCDCIFEPSDVLSFHVSVLPVSLFFLFSCFSRGTWMAGFTRLRSLVHSERYPLKLMPLRYSVTWTQQPRAVPIFRLVEVTRNNCFLVP